MNPRDLLDMAGDPRFIPGIYNYCDRWCERCAYTGRCLNFVHGEIMAAELEEDDESEALAEQLSESLQDAVDLIEIIAEEEGIELDLDSPEVEEMMAQEERARERAASHPLAGAADPYIGMVNDWFGVGKPEYTMDLPPLEGDGARAGDAAEVIRWFQFFISVKIRRALGSREHEADESEFWQEMPRDSDGTAKIALIAIDRSIGAWGTLLHAYPARMSATLEILALLSRLRLELEQEFPNAWSFIRPGLDETFDGPSDAWHPDV